MILNNKNKHHLNFLFPLVILTIVLLQASYGTFPNEYFGKLRILFSLMASLYFIYSTWCWGDLIYSWILKNKIERSLQLNLIMGIICLSVVMGILGHLGLIGYRYNYLFVLVLIMPQIYFYLKKSKPNFLSQLTTCLTDTFFIDRKYFLIIFASIGLLLFSFLQTFFFHMIRDVYVYHLAVPRVWWTNGAIEILNYYPLSFHSSWIEYFYMWGLPLLSAEIGKGLFSFVFFAQFLHFFLGIFSTFIVLNSIGKKLLAKNSPWPLFLSLIACDCYWLLWTSYTAKTDWIISFISLFSFKYIFEFLISKKNICLYLAALFLGFALVAKISLLVFIFALLTFMFITLVSDSKSINIKSYIGAIFAFFIFSTPILLRNYINTKNPFYPTFSNLFPSPQLPFTWLQITHSFEFSKIDNYLVFYLQWLKEILFSDFLIIVLPFSVFLLLKKRFEYKRLVFLSLNLFFWISLYILKTGRGGLTFVQFRLLGPVLILSEWLGAFFVLYLLQDYIVKKKTYMTWILNILAILWIFRPFMPWKNLTQFTQYQDPSAIFNTIYDSGGCRTWMTNNLPPNQTIYSMDFGVYYFMYNHNFSMIEQDPNVDNQIFFLKTGKEKAKKLKDLGVKFLYTHFSPTGVHYSKYSMEITNYLKNYPESIIHDGKLCLVFDLGQTKLEKF